MRRRVSILGSTGSIGVQTLQVILANDQHFTVDALAAGDNIELLVEQVHTFRPQMVGVRSIEGADRLRPLIPDDVDIVWGEEGLVTIAGATTCDTVVVAVVGAAGLRPTLTALREGKRVAFANKESLVAAGSLVMDALETYGGELLPVDSEHAAIHQALRGENIKDLHRLILTASGGPFRNAPLEHIQNATREQALKHPTWNMGGKITIDSATLMNKGLEVIEAHWLFNVSYDQIDVVIHPQSLIHSMVEYVDGSIIAQLGTADMRGPIQYALGYPERLSVLGERLSLIDQQLTFEAPDTERFPALALAYEAGRIGGTAPAVLNAANEIAVQAFLENEVPFSAITACVERVMTDHDVQSIDRLETVLQADHWARQQAHRFIAGMNRDGREVTV